MKTDLLVFFRKWKYNIGSGSNNTTSKTKKKIWSSDYSFSILRLPLYIDVFGVGIFFFK